MSTVLCYTEDPLLAVWLQETVEDSLPGAGYLLHDPISADNDRPKPPVMLAFVDLRQHQQAALAVVSQIREKHDAPVIVFARPAAAAAVVRAFDSGAIAYLDVHARDATLRHTLEKVLASSAGQASGEGFEAIGLNNRERAILEGMARGLTNAEIAAELFVSQDTIKTQVKKLFSRLGVHTRAGAVAEGIRRSLVA
ncbi:MAG: LuxR C-terminal-related transcriptional regulator [Actinomycetes bacterium]